MGLKEMVRTVDLLDALAAAISQDGPLVEGERGLKAHPAIVEARQQKIALARLTAALRLPAGDDDQPAGRRPQRRVGVRGVYVMRGS